MSHYFSPVSPQRSSPDRESCLEILCRYDVPSHIVAHSQRVAQVTVTLGRLLARSGLCLDLVLAEAGALLHDIAKMIAIERGGDHAAEGAEIVASLGFPEIGEIVRRHVHLGQEYDGFPRITEVVLVNYADKRVRHTEVVDLEDRFDDLAVRYGTTAEKRQRIQILRYQALRWEALIFQGLSQDPSCLNRLNRFEPHIYSEEDICLLQP